MTVLSDLVNDLRRMINEPTSLVYSDPVLSNMIEATAIKDVDGNEIDESDWIPTYNIYKVASLIWLEKASKVADEFDFNADGGSFSRSQKHQMYLKQASYYQSRSKAYSLELTQRPVTNLSQFGFEDTEYKDWIDEYESNLE